MDPLPALAKPTMRGRIHQVAFVVSIPAAVVLVVLARGEVARIAAFVYASSLTALLGSSAAYHVGSWSDRARRRMKCLDHSMIYVLIAGSYTPVSLLVLQGPWQVVILSSAWAGAALGVSLKLLRLDGLRGLTGTLYMVMGWLALAAFPVLLEGMTPATSVLMVTGGVLYTTGAIVFASHRPDPQPARFGYHEVWHALMVAGAACHWVMILLVVRAGT